MSIPGLQFSGQLVIHFEFSKSASRFFFKMNEFAILLNLNPIGMPNFVVSENFHSMEIPFLML